MKLSEKTLDVLENYASLNENLLIPVGNRMKTMSSARNVISFADVPDSFPKRVPIYNLVEFLKCVSLFDDPDFDFHDSYVDINEGGTSGVRYYYADESLLKEVPDKNGLPSEVDLEFNLSWGQLSKVLNASKIIGPTISIMSKVSNGKNLVVLRAHDSANASSNTYDVELCESPVSGDFELQFKAETMKFIEQDYKVRVLFKGISEFTNDSYGIKYFVGFTPAKTP